MVSAQMCGLQTLEVIKDEASKLALGIHSTSELSERVSHKIRQLDTAKSRVHSTLERIGVIVDRGNAVDGVRKALDDEDFETAATCLKSYFELEDKQHESEQDALEIQQAQEQKQVGKVVSIPVLNPAGLCLPPSPQMQTSVSALAQMLLEAKQQLKEVIEGRLTSAAQVNDHATVLRFVRLYAPLQLKVGNDHPGLPRSAHHASFGSQSSPPDAFGLCL